MTAAEQRPPIAAGKSGPLAAIAAELEADESVVSALVRPSPDAQAAFGELVAAGPGTRSDPAGYAVVVELVREGYLLHYGRPRIVAGADEDLALLAGDYLYALGLDRLAAIGDPPAVAELSDLISMVAALHAEDAGAAAPEAAWLAAAVVIATGAHGPDHEAAKRALIETHDAQGLYASARRRAEDAGLGERLAGVAETVGFATSDRG